MNASADKETSRIYAEYSRRDAAGLSQIYRYTNPAFTFHMHEREWAVLSMLRDERIDLPKCSVLEVGCGTGHILQRFLEFGAREATGIDLMEARIQTGRKMYPNVRLDQGNAAQLLYANDSFDLVMQFMCLSSVLDPTMRRQIAMGMWRVLRPGGAIVSYDLRPTPVLARVFRALFRCVLSKEQPIPTFEPVPKPTPTDPLSIQDVRNLFSASSLKYRTVSLDFDFARLATKSHLFTTFLANIPWLQTHYLVVIRKPLPGLP